MLLVDVMFFHIFFLGPSPQYELCGYSFGLLGGMEQKQQDDCEKSQRRCDDVVDYSLHS